jgi:hypothetical protein
VHAWISHLLTQIFSGDQDGDFLRKLFALLAIPLIVSLIAILVHWLVKGRMFPYFTQCLWVMWLVQTAALVIQYKP